MAGKLLVILGPTAIGKTRLAIDIAQALNGEIVGADSRQVYCHLDIGTAKPTPEERAQAPHHLIDMVDPDEELSLGIYQEMAYARIDDVLERGKLPLLVGGTGQYITAVTEGWSIPEVPPNPTLREELQTFAHEHGAQALYDRLLEIDPDAAAKIHPNNVRRTIRALEVCIETGEKMSVLQRKKPPPYHIMELGLTMERHTLYDRADQRVDLMLDAGFLKEVRNVLDMGYDRKLPSMSGVGYAQLAAHILDGVELEEAIYSTKTATHAFIRRQYTWFRGHDNGILWHNVEETSSETLIELCDRWLNG